MRNLLILLLMTVTAYSHAALPFKIQEEELQFGQNGAKITSDTADEIKINKTLQVGTGTATSQKLFEYNRGGSNPYFAWDEVNEALIFTNDGTVEKKLGTGGGGGDGGINILAGPPDDFNPNAESGLVEWTASNPGNFSLTTTATAALEGVQSFIFSPSVQNETLDSAQVKIGAGLYGNNCEARVFYKGSGAENSIQVLDGTGAVIKETVTPTHNVANFESVFFLCPTESAITATTDPIDELKVRITQTATTSADPIIFDRVHLGSTIGLVTIVDAQVEEKILSADATIDGIISELTFNNLEIGKHYEIKGQVRLNANGGGNTTFLVKHDGNTIGQAALVEPAGNNIMYSAISLTFKASASTLTFEGFSLGSGDSIDGNETKEETFVQLRRLVERQVYKAVPKIADFTNEFSAFVDGSKVVQDENVNWIDGDCSVVSSQIVCNLISGQFTATPVCVADADTVAANQTIAKYNYSASSSSQIVINQITSTNGASSTSAAFTIKCQKASQDYKKATTQLVLVNQVVSGQDDPIKICRIRQTSGTSTPSFESPDNCFGSGGRTNVGLTTVNLASGYFKSGSQVFCSCLGVTTSNNALNCGVYGTTDEGSILESETIGVAIDNVSASSFDNGYQLICIGDQP